MDTQHMGERMDPVDLRGARVLVVEDNPINQQIAAAFLKGAGAEVDLAGDGAAGVAKALEAGPGGYAAILMDIELPEMDGVEAAKRIRAAPGLAGIFIVAMTGHGDDFARGGARFDGHLKKPFDREAMMAALRAGGPARPHEAASAAAAAAAVGGGRLARLRTVDAPALLSILGDETFVIRLLTQMRASETGLADDIDAALAAGRRDEAARLAHRLKGVAGNLRAGAVHAAAARLESSLAGAASQDNGLELRVAATLRQALAALAADLDAVLDAPEAAAAHRRPLSDATLRRRLRRLVRLLDLRDLEADDAWAEISHAVHDRDAAAGAALEAALVTLDYAAAGPMADAFSRRLAA